MSPTRLRSNRPVLTIDAWLIRYVFQPIVDRASPHWTRYQIAAFLLTGAVGSLPIHWLATCLTMQPWYLVCTIAISNSMLGHGWYRWFGVWRRWEALEAEHGIILPPRLSEALYRFLHAFIAICTIGITVTVNLLTRQAWSLYFLSSAFTLATAAFYIVGCHPGTPKKRRQPASMKWAEA